MSFGIICFRVKNGSLEYLMIQRKDSLSFMEFIRGKYRHEQLAYISQLLSYMTLEERDMLMTRSFDDLWNIIWYQPSLPRQSNEYTEAKRKFESLREGVIVHGQSVTLEKLLLASPSAYTEPEWGFPKGRRHLREDDVHCAIREFCEETALETRDIRLVDLPPFEEVFFGTNGVLYRHVYYVASLQGNQARNTIVNPQNINQAREVRAISWFKYEDILNHIRPYNQERKALFQQVHQKIVTFLQKHGS